MLPLLTNRIAVYIDVQKIVAVRYKNILKKKVVHQKTMTIDRTSDKPEGLILAEALTKIFDEKVFKGCVTDFIFSQHYTKQRVAEWNAELSYDDKRALLSHQLTELYGLNGQSIEVILSDQGYNKNVIAFTLDQILYKAVNDLAKQKIIQSARITPYFAAKINYWYKSIAKDAWALIHEHNVIHIAKILDNNWQTFKTYPLSDLSTLAAIFKRELLFQENEDYSNVYLITESPEKFKDQISTLVLDARQKCFLLSADTFNHFPLDLRFLAYLD